MYFVILSFAEAMPAVAQVIQGLASGSTEKELEETLGGLVLATEEDIFIQ